MKPLLLLDMVDGPQENVGEKARRRAMALQKFIRRLRREGKDTVGMVDDAMTKGLTREQIAKTLDLCLRELPAWEERARARRWEREVLARVRMVFAAE